MDEQLRSNLTSSKHWVRFLYMILFAFFLYIASFLMVVLVVVQFAFALLSGSENGKLRVLGHELTLYIHQTLLFLTYNSDYKPFPFADWPSAPAAVETETVTTREPAATADHASGEVVAPATTAGSDYPTGTASPARSTDDVGVAVDTPEDSTNDVVRGDDGGRTAPNRASDRSSPVDHDVAFESDELVEREGVLERDEILEKDKDLERDETPDPASLNDQSGQGGRGRRS